MSALAENLYKEALDLSIDDRLKLIDRLLQSTNLPLQAEIDKAWAEEVEKRSQSLINGSAKLIPGEEVFAKIKNKFAR